MKIYKPEYHCNLAKEIAKMGYAITDAGDAMGVRYQTLLDWEKRYPEFKTAFQGIRANSKRWKAYRVERMMQKSEAELEAMLTRLRKKRIERAQKNVAELRTELD